MSSAPYFRLYFSDLAGDTLHLSDAEMGSYVLLIGAMWNAGGRLDPDEESLARIARCPPDKWARRWARLARFFAVADDGSICHKRVTEDREERARISAERSEAGKAGAQAKSLKSKGLGQANAATADKQLLPENGSKPQALPESRVQKGKGDANASLVAEGDEPAVGGSKGYDPRFQAAWDAYPHVTGRSSRPKAYGFWRKAAKTHGSTRLQAAIERFAREGREPRAECGAKGFHLWLRDALYEGWLSKAGAPDAPKQPPAAQWGGPADIRAEAVFRQSEEWAAAWLDRARWQDLPAKAIVAHSPTSKAKLDVALGAWLRERSISIILEAEAAA